MTKISKIRKTYKKTMRSRKRNSRPDISRMYSRTINKKDGKEEEGNRSKIVERYVNGAEES